MHISHLTFRAAKESCFWGGALTAIYDKFFFLPYTAKKDKAAYFLFLIKLFKQCVFCIDDKTLTLETYL